MPQSPQLTAPFLSSKLWESPRSLAALALLAVGVLFAMFFAGTSVNLYLLTIGLAFVLTAVVVTGPRMLALHDGSVGTFVCVACLVLFPLNYAFSLSPDSSFVPLWVLALIPITFLVVRELDAQTRRLAAFVPLVLIVGFACVSIFRFAFPGDLKYEPIFDPNNAVSLLYVAWIPLVHGYVTNQTRIHAALFYGLTGVLILAIAINGSRVGLTIVVVALLVWAVLAAFKRCRLGPVLVQGALLAFCVVGVELLLPTHTTGAEGAGIGTGAQVRLLMIDSALQMLRYQPLTGIGVFVFPLLYPAHRHLGEQETLGFFAHNDYVQLLVEGGPLFVALLGVWLVGTVLRFFRSAATPGLPRMGWVMALGALLAHAAVNFVLLTTVLGIILGGLSAMVWPRANEAQTVPVGAKTGFAAAVVFLICGWGYLVLDTAIYGVFQGQYVPFAASVRQDPARQLDFAESARSLNTRRGIPVLAEAMLRGRDESIPLMDRVALFHKAIDTDPFNPNPYVSAARFMAFSGVEAHDGHTPETLLLRAVAINPIDVAAIDTLIRYYGERNLHGKNYGMLRSKVYPWLELLARHDEENARRYLSILEELSTLVGDAEFRDRLVADRARIDAVVTHNERLQRPGRV